MQIREMEERDNKMMEQIIKHSLESFDLNIPGTAYFDPQLSALAEFYKKLHHAKYWVAVNEENEVKGGIGIAPFEEKTKTCELQKLYVKPEAQGRGLAKALLKTALNFAEKHYTYCYLETMEKLETANFLYIQFGFQQLEQPLEGSEHSTMDAWYMKKLSQNY